MSLKTLLESKNLKTISRSRISFRIFPIQKYYFVKIEFQKSIPDLEITSKVAYFKTKIVKEIIISLFILKLFISKIRCQNNYIIIYSKIISK